MPRCGPPSPCAMHGYSGPRPSPAQATLSEKRAGVFCWLLHSENIKAWIACTHPLWGGHGCPCDSSCSHWGFFMMVTSMRLDLRLGSPEGASGAFGAGPMTALARKPGV